MHSKTLNKAISILITVTFLLSNTNIGYGAPGSRSLFKNKKIDYDKITNERQDTLQKQQSIIKGEDAKELEAQDKASKKILQANLSDISQIHIPQEIGRVVEVYQAPNSETQTQSPLIVGIQDLHTNPEAELNLAKTLEILLKDYKMGLVCSEGADGVVDTSSISSFPDTSIKEKVSRIFIDSGELTGEEYLSITKYPELPIWGIEDKDIYFKNILDFNKIMKFNPNSQVFISQTKKAVEELKPRIYSKELIELDKKELEFSSQKLDTANYIAYLTSYADKFKLNTTDYKNIMLLNETTQMEKTINQPKIMSESSNLILYLQSVLMNKNLKADLDTLMARAKLFNDQKSSPFSFYGYLKDLALKHIKDDFKVKYSELNNFIDYLTKVNSLDSTKLFLELENLNFEIKETIAKADEQKLLIKASRNINFLESFFNLKVSNEDLDYYVNHRDEHKVAFFKDFLSPIIKKYNINTFIDYNPALIDSHFQELEEFYKVVKDRDVAMVKNSLSEIEKRNVKLASLVHGGFHTKGITKLLREKGYSYIIVSPYSKTDINEENYHFLLQGRRKPITELLQKLDLSKIIDNLMNYKQESLRVILGFSTIPEKAYYDGLVVPLAKELKVSEDELKSEKLSNRMNQAIATAISQKSSKEVQALLERWGKAKQPIPVTQIIASKTDVLGVIILKIVTREGDIYFKLTKKSEREVGVDIAQESEFRSNAENIVASTLPALGASGVSSITLSTETMRDARIIAIDFVGTLDVDIEDNLQLIKLLLEADRNLIILIVTAAEQKLVSRLANVIPNDPRLKIYVVKDKSSKDSVVRSVANERGIGENFVIAIGDSYEDGIMALGGSFIKVGSKLKASDVLAKILEAKRAGAGLSTAMIDTLMPMGLSYDVKQEEVRGLSQVTIYSNMLEGFLDPDQASTKMEGLVERDEKSVMGFMRKVFETGAKQINDLDSERRKNLRKDLYDLFKQAGKKDITFYLASSEFVGEGVYMRKVKIKGAEKYAVLINRKYFDAVDNVVEKIKNYTDTRKASMIDAVYYTVFERVMHELLENESLLEKALASDLGHPEKGDAIKKAIIEIETNSFINTDAKLYAYLCHGEMAGAIDLVRNLLKDSDERGDRHLARTIFGPNRYKKLELLFDEFGKDVLFRKPLLEAWGSFKAKLMNYATAFVGTTYTGADTTAMADKSSLLLSSKTAEELLFENAFVIRANKIMIPEEQARQMNWLSAHQDANLVVLINNMEELKAVKDIKDVDRVYLVILKGNEALTREAILKEIGSSDDMGKIIMLEQTEEYRSMFVGADSFAEPTPFSTTVEEGRKVTKEIGGAA